MSDDTDSNVVQLPHRGGDYGAMPDAPDGGDLFYSEPPDNDVGGVVPPESPQETTMELPAIRGPISPETALRETGMPDPPDSSEGEYGEGEYVQARSLADRLGDWLEHRLGVARDRHAGESAFREAEIARKTALVEARTAREVAMMEQNAKLHTAMMKAKADRAAARGKGEADRTKSSGSGLGADKGGRSKAGGGGSSRGNGGNSGGSGRGSGTNGSAGTGRGSGGGSSPKGTGKGSDRSAGGRGGPSRGNESSGGSGGRQNGSGGSGSGKAGTGKGSSGGGGSGSGPGKGSSGNSGTGSSKNGSGKGGSKGDGSTSRNAETGPAAERARGRQERAAARQAARQQRRSANQDARIADRTKDRDQDRDDRGKARDQARANKQAAREERRTKKAERKAARKAKREAAKTANDRTTLSAAVAEEAQRRWDKRRAADVKEGKDKDDTAGRDSEATKKPSKDGSETTSDGQDDAPTTKKTKSEGSKNNAGKPSGGTGTGSGSQPGGVKAPPDADDESGAGKRSFKERVKDRFGKSGTASSGPAAGTEEPPRMATPEDLGATVDSPGRPSRPSKTERAEEEIPDAVIVDDPADPFGAYVSNSAGLPAPETHTESPGSTRPTAQEDPVAAEVKRTASGQTGMAAKHRTDITFGEYLVEIVNIALASEADKDRAQELAIALGKVADALRDMAVDLGSDHNVATEVVDQITDLADSAASMKRLAERCAAECGIASQGARLTAFMVGFTYGEDVQAMDDAGLAHASAAAHHD